MQNSIFDVIVVGGGPVGLWLSCELRLAGLNVCVIERRTERTTQSRALTLHGRTLEIFSLRQLADRFLSKGKPIATGHFGVLNTRLDFSMFNSTFPYTLFLPQATTEKLIEEHALAIGVEIRRGCTVSNVGQDNQSVWVKASTDETSFHLQSRYLVGADGARSIVRQKAEINFTGIAAQNTMMLGDVQLDMPQGQVVISKVNEHGCLMIAPLGDGVHHRIVTSDPLRQDIPTNEAVTLDELKNSVNRILGLDLQAREPIWLSRFSDETRIAAQYRKQRIFLAGDAAHIHAPTGGQGMNVGIQDAMNLGWKLASVLNGLSPEAILDSYETERRPVGLRLYQNTLSQTALVTKFDQAHLALRGLLDEMLRQPELNHKLAGEVSGFDVCYPKPLFKELDEITLESKEVGQRMNDANVTLINGDRTTLYNLMREGAWLQLIFDDTIAPLPDWLNEKSAKRVMIKSSDSMPWDPSIKSLLVRPDGYYAKVWRSS